jgi:hypothetical protein
MTGNGSVSGPIKAVGFLSSMDVWWAGQDDSVQGGSWSQGQPWQQYELAPPLSISRGIRAVAHCRGHPRLTYAEIVTANVIECCALPELRDGVEQRR